jgi:hypothetical protein
VHGFEPRRAIENFGRQVCGGAGANRCVIKLTGLGLHERDKFLSLSWPATAGATASTLVIDAISATGAKSSIERYGGVFCNKGGHDERRRRNTDGVTVGCCRRNQARANKAARSGPVISDHLLAIQIS